MHYDPPPSEDDLHLWNNIETAPTGTFRMYTADQTGVQKNLTQHFNNSSLIKSKILKAINSDCHIEAMSLKIQIIDFWLRIYHENSQPTDKRERMFGPLLRQAFDLGMPKKLYDDLMEFNNSRVDAIHGFMIGCISYEKIMSESIRAIDLVKRTVEFVAKNSGTIVTHREHIAANPGAMILNINAFCADIDSLYFETPNPYQKIQTGKYPELTTINLIRESHN